jgi:hypothetical protein
MKVLWASLPAGGVSIQTYVIPLWGIHAFNYDSFCKLLQCKPHQAYPVIFIADCYAIIAQQDQTCDRNGPEQMYQLH